MIGWLTAPRVIEPVRDSDYETLEEIHAASFPVPWSADEQALMNDGPGVETLVVRRGSATGTRRPLGFITMRRAADEAEVLTMAVYPRHRRAGLGRLLLDAALRRLYAERVREVFLEVDPANTAALALYRRVGFEVVGERAQYYRAGSGGRVTPALTMRLAITQPATRTKVGA